MTPRGLRLCLLAYPLRVRRTEGDLLLALAEDLAAGGGSRFREALGLLQGGLELRFGLSGAPWRAALTRLAPPLAGLFLVVMSVGALLPPAEPLRWPGWTWSAGVVGATLVSCGMAWRRDTPSVLGAALVLGVCVLDAWRDLGGTGSRWTALFVDVLPALLPGAALLLVCALAVAGPAVDGARRAAWTLSGAGAGVLLATLIRDHATPGTTVLAAAALFVCGALLMAVRRPRSVARIRLAAAPAPEARLAGALALLAAVPGSTWVLLAGLQPNVPDAAGLVILYGSWALLAATALMLARSSARTPLRED